MDWRDVVVSVHAVVAVVAIVAVLVGLVSSAVFLLGYRSGNLLLGAVRGTPMLIGSGSPLFHAHLTGQAGGAYQCTLDV